MFRREKKELWNVEIACKITLRCAFASHKIETNICKQWDVSNKFSQWMHKIKAESTQRLCMRLYSYENWNTNMSEAVRQSVDNHFDVVEMLTVWAIPLMMRTIMIQSKYHSWRTAQPMNEYVSTRKIGVNRCAWMYVCVFFSSIDTLLLFFFACFTFSGNLNVQTEFQTNKQFHTNLHSILFNYTNLRFCVVGRFGIEYLCLCAILSNHNLFQQMCNSFVSLRFSIVYYHWTK